MFDTDVRKPILAAALVSAAEYWYFKNPDVQNIALYGIAIGASQMVAAYLAPAITPSLTTGKTSYGISLKTVEERIVEFSLAAGTSILGHQYIHVGWDFRKPDLLANNERLMVLVAAEVLSEYLVDYGTTQPLEFFE